MVAPIDSSPTPCLPAMRGPDGEAIAATAISRSEYRGSWRLGAAQVEPVGPHGEGLVAAQQVHDGVHALVQHAALLGGLDADHVGVGRQGARADAEHEPAPGLVVELHDAVRRPQWVVVRHRQHAAAEADGPGAFERGGAEEQRVGDDLGAAGVVLAHPHLVEAQLVEVLDQLQVTVQGRVRVVVVVVERRHEDAELHAVRDLAHLWDPRSSGDGGPAGPRRPDRGVVPALRRDASQRPRPRSVAGPPRARRAPPRTARRRSGSSDGRSAPPPRCGWR